MKAYSPDFRQKVIEPYEQEFISQRELAERFRISLSLVTRFLRQHRETGQISPKPSHQGRLKLCESWFVLNSSI